MGKKSRRARQEAQEQQSSRRTKRGLALLVGGLACAGTVFGVLSRSATSVSPVSTGSTSYDTAPVNSRAILEEAYRLALGHPEERQKFLDLLAGAYPDPHCERIIFDPDFSQNTAYTLAQDKQWAITSSSTRLDPVTTLAAAPINLRIFGRPAQVPIFVGDYLFNRCWTQNDQPFISLDDAISLITEHEAKHASDMCKGITLGGKTYTYRDFPGPLYPDQFFTDLKESRAYYHQLRRIDNHPRISDSVYANTLQQAERHIAGLYICAAGLNYAGDVLVREIANRQIAEFPDIQINYLGVESNGTTHHVSVDFLFVKKPELLRVDISALQAPR